MRAIATCRLGAASPGGLALPAASPTPSQFYAPRGVFLDDDWLVVADSGNHRILLWRGLPTQEAQPADVVLCQPDFLTEGPRANGRGPSNGLHLPTGVAIHLGHLIVADPWHHRILVWERVPTVSDTPPDYALGQSGLESIEPNQGGKTRGDTLYWPYSFGFAGERFYIADTGNRRVLGWQGFPLPGQLPHVVLGQTDEFSKDENRHGGGGQLTSELIEHIFVPAFRNTTLEGMADSSVLAPPTGRLAFSTDSYVVQPLFFPGGSIGDLAVHGTVNDLAMSGATPLYLSAGFILEEGFPLSHLAAIVDRMAAAARAAGVQIVTGDTKVVEKGHGDGCYINTSGIGVIADNIHIGPALASPGDVVIVSGTIGDHGMAIMSVREGLEFETIIQSDTAALNGLVASLLQFAPHLHVLRDPTRGGLASSLNEIAAQSKVGILIEERTLPVLPDVQAACDLLGMDPVYVPMKESWLQSSIPSSLMQCWRECESTSMDAGQRLSAPSPASTSACLRQRPSSAAHALSRYRSASRFRAYASSPLQCLG